MGDDTKARGSDKTLLTLLTDKPSPCSSQYSLLCVLIKALSTLAFSGDVRLHLGVTLMYNICTNVSYTNVEKCIIL